MADIIEQIRVLLRKSNGDSEEHRSSAWIACKLMREHNIVLSFPDTTPKGPPLTAETKDGKPYQGPSVSRKTDQPFVTADTAKRDGWKKF